MRVFGCRQLFGELASTAARSASASALALSRAFCGDLHWPWRGLGQFLLVGRDRRVGLVLQPLRLVEVLRDAVAAAFSRMPPMRGTMTFGMNR